MGVFVSIGGVGSRAYARCGALAVCLALAVGTNCARAQEAGTSLADEALASSVGARSKAAYDAPGLPLGGFRFYPRADLRIEYDDNVFNIAPDPRGDAKATFEPGFELVERTPDAGLSVKGQATLTRYADLKVQNNEQYSLEAAGHKAFGPVRLDLSGSYGLLAEMAGTLGDAGIGAPNTYSRLAGRAGLSVALANLTVSLAGGAERFDYRTIRLEGLDVLQNYRDRTATTLGGRASLRLGPALRVFAQGRYNWQDYRQDFGAISQDSQGYALSGGLAFGFSELLSGEVTVGYLSQDYDEPASGTVSGITYSGRLVWNVTTLVTVKLNGARTLEASPFFNQPGVIQDSISLDVDYELLRNLVVSVNTSYLYYDYFGSDRRDRQFRIGANARWLLGDRFEVGLGFSHRDQSSRGFEARPFTGSTALLSVRVKF